MATKKKPVTQEELEEDFAPEEIAAETENADDKDKEIAKLKAELAKAKKASASEVFIPNGRGDMERLQQLARDTAEAGKDPWKISVRMRVPKKAAGDDDYWVNVNGISAQIPANGEIQEMKLPWAMTLMDALEAEERAMDFADNITMYDPVTNPKPMG